jgi:hypothetical protein
MTNIDPHQTETSKSLYAWLETASIEQLIEFHNKYAERRVRAFSDRQLAVDRCRELWDKLQVSFAGKVINTKERSATGGGKRPAMSESLRLPDRRVRCIETGEVWANALKLRRDRPDWMTSGQQDRLTRQLYNAAKAGQRAVVEINGRSFELVNSFLTYEHQKAAAAKGVSK